MPAVHAYAQRLMVLQSVWDNLALLSQLGSSDADSISRTRTAFETLSGELVSHLTAETCRKSVLTLAAKAQMAIDVLVRNLFERTADIGFLSQDGDLVSFLQSCRKGEPAPRSEANLLRRRLQEYVAKYSVYSDVVVTSTDGRILARLDEAHSLESSADPVLSAALTTSGSYVEQFGPTDLLGNGRPVLRYAFRVVHQGSVLGCLCLCFRLDDEIQSLFGRLLAPRDWTVLALLDREGTVLASSDPWQCPRGARLERGDAGGSITRFAGREYLAVTQLPHAFQDYAGPGWVGHAMIPVAHAFEQAAEDAAPKPRAGARSTPDIFSEEFKQIPRRALGIQNDLALSVWNGNVRLSTNSEGDSTFSRALLREISHTGRRTREIFEDSIRDLQDTTISALIDDCAFRAALAVDVLDRNLYERANDCRWWALNGSLRDALENKTTAERATEVLAGINALYTVYDSILLFDTHGRVIAASRPARRSLVGTALPDEWVQQCLSLRDTQAWTASRFAPLRGYDDRPTYVFCAAVRSEQGRAIGGVAVVLDSATQLPAICRDALQGVDDPRALVVLVNADGTVLAANQELQAGARFEIEPPYLSPPPAGTAGIIERGGIVYAVGARQGKGYREYPGLGTVAIAMRALGSVTTQDNEEPGAFQFSRLNRRGAQVMDLATFRLGPHWAGLPSTHILEATRGLRVTRLPDRPDWCNGVLMYRDSAVPVLDLRVLLDGVDVPASDLVVMVQADGRTLGLVADALGDVIQVTPDEIADLDPATQAERRSCTRQMLRPRAAADSAVLLLDLPNIRALFDDTPG